MTNHNNNYGHKTFKIPRLNWESSKTGDMIFARTMFVHYEIHQLPDGIVASWEIDDSNSKHFDCSTVDEAKTILEQHWFETMSGALEETNYAEGLQEAQWYLRNAVKEFQANPDEYNQARKDAARLMLAFFVDAERQESLRDLVESSPRARPFDQDVIVGLLKDFLYDGAALLWECLHEDNVHRQTIKNMKDVIERYEYLSRERGILPVIDDHSWPRNN